MGRYIEIVGILGSGKSSLLKVFNEKAGYVPIVEKEDDLKRLFFLDGYLSDMVKYAFEGVVNFTAFHLNRIKQAFYDVGVTDTHTRPPQDMITDTSLLLQYAYSKPAVPKDELNLISRLIEKSQEKLPKPDLRIVLTLPGAVHVDRLTERNRRNERGITKEFLENSQVLMKEALKKFGNGVPTLHLDSSKLDWVNNEADKQKVIDLVERKFAQIDKRNARKHGM